MDGWMGDRQMDDWMDGWVDVNREPVRQTDL